MAKKKITYTDEPLGPLKVIPDFLPRPAKTKKRDDRDAAEFIGALLDDAPRIPRLVKAARDYLRRVDQRERSR